MNEHDMISNISYIMHCYPEMTNEILIKHGANPDNEFWTTGCDISSAYEEILKCLESRYDRNDQDTQLDYHIQEILGWHDVNESVESDLEIPAPYNKYYEFSPNEVNYEELPDAFDHYKDLKVVAELYAKEQYEDALADNCLDFCWLVSDNGRLMLVTTAGLRVYPITLEEIHDCVGVDEDFDVREPSSVEYGDAMSRYFRMLTDTIEKYGIRKIGRKRSIEYDGVVNGYKFFFVEANTGTGHYAKELYINGREVNLYQSKDSERSFSNLNEMNYFGILSLVKMLETDNLSGIVYKDDLDDYTESLVEDTEMSDAQRLALQELDSCLEYGELDAEKHALAYQIQWDINFEDILLFINGIDIPLQDIKHVEYGDCDETKFDGCYNVTLHDGTTKKYGWHDFDATASLTLIEDLRNSVFQPGDRVYVTVSNRQGTVLQMVSPDVVEVEFEANGTYPARIDRFYTSEVELVDLRADTDLPEDEEHEVIELEHPEDIDDYLRDPHDKFIPDDEF